MQWQVQAQVAATSLGSSPGQALLRAGQIRNRVERTLPGQIQFVDNLSDSLNTAAGDALYAETLYIMLAVPGALIALGLAYLAALGTVERDRRELSLLRARGGSRRSLVGFALIESVVIGTVAGLIGSGLAALAVTTLVTGTTTFTLARTLATVALSIAVAVVGAASARIGASARVFTRSVSEGRRSVERERKPLWQRLYLDLLALAVSGLIYWLTARTGFSAVVNPDSNPTLSLVDLHVLRARAALDRRDALPRPDPRTRGHVPGRPKRRQARDHNTCVPARQRKPTRCGDQPRPRARRTSARLRCQPRHLHRHLRPAGTSRRATNRRRRRRPTPRYAPWRLLSTANRC